MQCARSRQPEWDRPVGLPILVCKTSRDAVAAMHTKPAMMLIEDADTPAKWYDTLNAPHRASAQTGQLLDHPFKDRVTLCWKGYAQ